MTRLHWGTAPCIMVPIDHDTDNTRGICKSDERNGHNYDVIRLLRL